MVAPIAEPDAFLGLVNAPVVITPTDLFTNDQITDSQIAAGTQPLSITIGAIPTGGSLYLVGVLQSVSAVNPLSVTYAQLNAGNLTFAPSASGVTTGSFEYSVTDNGGTSSPPVSVSINFGIDTLTVNPILGDGVTNASQYSHVYSLDFNLDTKIASNVTDINVGLTAITDKANGTGVGAEIVPIASGASTGTADNIETSGESVGLTANSAFKAYLDNLFPGPVIDVNGNTIQQGWSITYPGFKINGDPILAVYDVANDTSSYYVTTDVSPTSIAANIARNNIAVSENFNYSFCFEKNTLISTPAGEKLVSTLAIGDEVLTADNRKVKVQWIGLQTINSYFAKLNGNLPVKICSGALGDGIPTGDLLVSPNHAMLVDGILVHALALVNGKTITQLQSWVGNVEYFHIETENHELILANGAPAETFIDNVSRKEFDNWAEYESLYPNVAPMIELDLPRVKFARQLPKAISERLEVVAQMMLSNESIAA